jgi:hypothetical protein
MGMGTVLTGGLRKAIRGRYGARHFFVAARAADVGKG